jgi:cyclopropane fatty-acyl-phospholipid synthase-like methyltransferase
MSKDQCRLCGDSHLHPVLSLNNAPRNVQRLFRKEDVHEDRSVDLTVLMCDRCGFVQVIPLLEDSYYDDYMMLATHSPQVQEYQERQSRQFIEKFNLVGKLVKEIGCGDGSYLNHLKAAGCVPSGVEPSARSREIALARGHEVESGYVTATRQLNGGPYDGFVTRQVLEHVTEIHSFLTGIRLNLKPGAVGLVEVPSLEKALADRRYYDFFPDHVNYFSLRTLRLALEINGFEVLEMHHDMFDEYIIAVVKNYAQPQFSEIANTVNSLSAELCSFIERYHARGQKVAIWGAGGKGLSVMAAAGISEIDLLVDGDPNKQGLITPVSHLKVEAPSALLDAGVSAVIITAMAYKTEIERTLIDDLHFDGDIAVLGHQLQLLSNS